MEKTSIGVGRAALHVAISESRAEEMALRKEFEAQGIRSCAVDFGGAFTEIIPKIIERAVVAAERQELIHDNQVSKGAVVGATAQALEQLKNKCVGLNVGGKVGIARSQEHLSVAIYLGVGVLHLDEIAVAMAHRAVPSM